MLKGTTAHLISQKSKIFDSFPSRGSLGALRALSHRRGDTFTKINYNLFYPDFGIISILLLKPGISFDIMYINTENEVFFTQNIVILTKGEGFS